MRIAVGQLWQETNTFNRNPTTFDDFENWGVAVGPEILEQFGETGELGGFLQECRAWSSSDEIVGLARFACWPWGPVAIDTWQHIQNIFIKELSKNGKVDAVFLALHGAMASDNEEDITGALLKLIRESVGPRVPIVGTLDLHANITSAMIEHADLLVGYHTCPHLDAAQTGQRAARGLRTILETGNLPTTYWQKLPMITAAENHNTFTGIPAPLYRKLEQLERDEDVLSAGLYMAMPWFDCAQLGWTVTLTTTAGSGKWKAVVNELARSAWDLREQMEDVERFPPDEVIDKALAFPGYPIAIGDGADATNSGSPGDQTHLLAELLSRKTIPHGAMTFLVDPEAVELAHRIGKGGTFLAMVGAAFAPEYSNPIELRGTIERLLKVEFVLDGHIGKKLPIRMGRGAVVRAGAVSVLLTERSGPGSSPKLYETAGLEPKSCGIVIAKSPAGFRADYEPFVAAVFLADSPGCATPNWQRLNFHRVNRPLWPLDQIDRPQDAKWYRSVQKR